MARTVFGPPRNNAYVAMLGLACVSMTLGCALLGLEISGYDPATPPTFQAVSLPKAEARSAPPSAGTPAGGGPAPPPGGSAKVEPPPTPAPAPVVVPQLPKFEPPAVVKVDPPKVEPPKLEDPA